MAQPLLSVRDLRVEFAIGGGLFEAPKSLKAVDGISFDLMPGETLGVVGESGCGKSTLGRAVLRLIEPTGGKAVWLGKELGGLNDEAMRQVRRDMTIIFQDPLAALDPRMTVEQIIAEPLVTFRKDLGKEEVGRRVRQMMARVGLSPQHVNRYPHEFSGGQCQRIGIARAMILEPKLVVCDEPVSALDVSIQSQIINLLIDLQRELDLALIFISHNLAVVKHISHRIAVLYLGRLVELGDAAEVFNSPKHPYTRALISAVPMPDPELEERRQRIPLIGELPSPLNPPSGCSFRTRCPYVIPKCAEQRPEREFAFAGHEVACHRWPELEPFNPLEM
ncbi:ABC transporter ATP-binding protein [Lacibacterium aquatile]|uniref:ABC transporter ATP-binding protein n=1 Tax=Lacibacterium aquatile TaxID=1168082 RepID=A0ABW5DPX3_9PROT